jgi:hypothetical protein
MEVFIYMLVCSICLSDFWFYLTCSLLILFRVVISMQSFYFVSFLHFLLSLLSSIFSFLASCNDSDACTTGDICRSGGTCGGQYTCGCTNDTQCATIFGVCSYGTCVSGNCVEAKIFSFFFVCSLFH